MEETLLGVATETYRYCLRSVFVVELQSESMDGNVDFENGALLRTSMSLVRCNQPPAHAMNLKRTHCQGCGSASLMFPARSAKQRIPKLRMQ